MVSDFLNNMLTAVQSENFDELDNLIAERSQIFDWQKKIEKNQIKRIKKKITNSRNSQLFFKINAEIQNLLLHAINVFKAQRDFIINTRGIEQTKPADGENDTQNSELNTGPDPGTPVKDV
jgi:hypothetical protein